MSFHSQAEREAIAAMKRFSVTPPPPGGIRVLLDGLEHSSSESEAVKVVKLKKTTAVFDAVMFFIFCLLGWFFTELGWRLVLFIMLGAFILSVFVYAVISGVEDLMDVHARSRLR